MREEQRKCGGGGGGGDCGGGGARGVELFFYLFSLFTITNIIQ